jgi:hypothetical protein
MKFLNLNLFYSALFAWTMAAQTSTVKVSPDCLFTGTVSGSGVTVVAANGNGDNRSIGCSSWVVVWEVTGGGSPTVTIQSAVTVGGSPVSWVTFAGTVLVGANPSTATVGTVALSGFVPWVRVQLANGGTLSVRMFGYRNTASGSGGGGGGNVTVNNFPNPQNTAPNVAYGLPACSLAPSRQSVSISGTGALQIVGSSGTTSIKLCKVQLAANTATTIQFLQGTGVNCGTGTGAIFGGAGLPNVTNVALDYDGGMILSAGQAFCISSTVAAAISGVVTYVQN